MYRKTIWTILIAICCTTGYAQSKLLDSLESALKSSNNPVERFDILNNIVLELNVNGNTVDSAATVEMLKIAQQLKSDSLLAISYNWLGTYFSQNKADNTTALEYLFKGIPYAKKVKDKRRISSLYFDLAVVYFDMQENEQALAMTLEGGKNLPNPSHPLYYFMLVQYQSNLAQYYLTTRQADSAFYYAMQSEKIYSTKFSENLSYKFLSYTVLGGAYALKQMPKLADSYFLKALELFHQTDRPGDGLLFYTTYIPYLLSSNRIPEAKFHAENSLTYGTRISNNNLKLVGAGYLRQIFDTLNQVDSAYYYARMEADINTLIFSRSNKTKLQALAFNEQLRQFEDERQNELYQNRLIQYALGAGLFVFFLVVFFLWRNNRQKKNAHLLLQNEKYNVDNALTELKSTQSQLIQSEKMASLGELTAGIAHEIQNPLNFVNNFSEVSNELIDEMNDELEKGDFNEAKIISKDIKQNLEKINHHGKRADAIVKGMLQHSQSSTGKKEPTDINALCDEYLRLSYHGLRAKNKSFNATMKTDFDNSIGNINIIPQDIGRVILNLLTNAFYVVDEKKKSGIDNLPAEQADYEPTVYISTKKLNDKVEIRVTDNGNGIPQKVLDKIFQPFFTTKPTGQGTGLGLSLAYDIVTKGHGGELKVETKDGEGTEFIIQLPAV